MSFAGSEPSLAGDGVPSTDTRTGVVRQIIRTRRSAIVGLSILVFFVGIAVFAPLLEPYGVHQQVGPVFGPPSVHHWFGLDDGGIDMTSLLIQGGRISLVVGFAAALVATFIGGGIGLVAGYVGGETNVRILARHVLPQIAPLLIANVVLTVAVAIFDETALAFFGLSDPSAVSWGTIIEHAFQRAAISSGYWWAIVPPGICVALVIMGCYLVGQAIEDALNPRLRVAHLSVNSFRLRALAERIRNPV